MSASVLSISALSPLVASPEPNSRTLFSKLVFWSASLDFVRAFPASPGLILTAGLLGVLAPSSESPSEPSPPPEASPSAPVTPNFFTSLRMVFFSSLRSAIFPCTFTSLTSTVWSLFFAKIADMKSMMDGLNLYELS